ncbi:hypothetical protein BS50DRAFT_628525 [Corynespora cassiicola Philippines]|uniref:Uncharacterized protein n=1 Tax=Corynespora cassiicola Philippines TaxID=1448308 RepID=A0A2T2PCG1_CORCC|nr:hypothetical protein BS50DRAFT_628525 [Corynespora cassiicola Philippines]
MNFFSLPIELRWMVYHHAADIDSNAWHDYWGFYISCRQIKNEMDAECRKVWDMQKARILSQWPASARLKPLNILGCPVQDVELSWFCIGGIPTWPNYTSNIDFNTIKPILDLHLRSLILEVGSATTYTEDFQLHRLHYLKNTLRVFDSVLASHLILEMNPQYDPTLHMTTLQASSLRGKYMVYRARMFSQPPTFILSRFWEEDVQAIIPSDWTYMITVKSLTCVRAVFTRREHL